MTTHLTKTVLLFTNHLQVKINDIGILYSHFCHSIEIQVLNSPSHLHQFVGNYEDEHIDTAHKRFIKVENGVKACSLDVCYRYFILLCWPSSKAQLQLLAWYPKRELYKIMHEVATIDTSFSPSHCIRNQVQPMKVNTVGFCYRT